MKNVRTAVGVLALLLLVGASAPVPASATMPAALFAVPAGTTVEVTAPIVASEVLVEGLLVAAPGADLIIEAQAVHIASGGMILGSPGEPGASYAGLDATAGDGEAGSSIFITADSIQIDEAGFILGGWGGTGGTALAYRLAEGGHGGKGGSLHLNAQTIVTNNGAWPGSGGTGGYAAIASSPYAGVATPTAIGGDGGDSGFLFLNGEFAGVPQSEPTFPHVLVPSEPVEPMPTGGENDLDALRQLGLSEESSTWFEEFGIPIPILPTPCGTTPPAGEPGKAGAGNGGRGGDGCADVLGPNGVDGTGGLFVGSPGGPGGHATGGGATGGNGGLGVKNGGKGGDASSNGVGGNGGKGGAGGAVGGDGGNGGDGAGGTAQGGNGGQGLCGEGGEGGGATSKGTGGTGGAGGWGTFVNGNSGASGTGKDGTANGGEGAPGLNIC